MSAIPTLRYHAEQQRLLWSPCRFKVVHAGRRSGKTMLAKLRVIAAAAEPPHADANYFAAAPTRDQAKGIFWRDLLDWLAPITRSVNHSELAITTLTGATARVVGLDKAERIEGTPWDGGVITEIGNLKPDAWGAHIRPALSTLGREGWCWLEGVPEGRNWFFADIASHVMARETGWQPPEWDVFTWPSADIIDSAEVEAARQTLDALTFRQEYLGEFVSYGGLAYYAYDPRLNVRPGNYAQNRPLIVCLDFNAAPGVAVFAQEHDYGTQVLGEVWIPHGSTTQLVCERIVDLYRNHRAPVLFYGDASGGSGGSARVAGSDWDIVRRVCRGIGTSVAVRHRPANPRVRARVNAVNSRLCSATDERRLFVDADKAPHLCRDFEHVGTSTDGGLDKSGERRGLTHVSDALGYYVEYEYSTVVRQDTGPATIYVGPSAL